MWIFTHNKHIFVDIQTHSVHTSTKEVFWTLITTWHCRILCYCTINMEVRLRNPLSENRHTACKVNRLQSGHPKNCELIPSKATDSTPLQSIQTGLGVYPASNQISTWAPSMEESSHRITLTTHLHLAPMELYFHSPTWLQGMVLN